MKKFAALTVAFCSLVGLTTTAGAAEIYEPERFGTCETRFKQPYTSNWYRTDVEGANDTNTIQAKDCRIQSKGYTSGQIPGTCEARFKKSGEAHWSRVHIIFDAYVVGCEVRW